MLLSILVMRVIGIELERMSLATLIIALGLLVDNGIVIAEDISRRLAEGEERLQGCHCCGQRNVDAVAFFKFNHSVRFYAVNARR